LPQSTSKHSRLHSVLCPRSVIGRLQGWTDTRCFLTAEDYSRWVLAKSQKADLSLVRPWKSGLKSREVARRCRIYAGGLSRRGKVPRGEWSMADHGWQSSMESEPARLLLLCWNAFFPGSHVVGPQTFRQRPRAIRRRRGFFSDAGEWRMEKQVTKGTRHR
jgi:hypothetical protein